MPFTEEKPTLQLRFIRRQRVGEHGSAVMGEFLQQLWKVTRGEGGRVVYVDEWRDVPVEQEGENV